MDLTEAALTRRGESRVVGKITNAAIHIADGPTRTGVRGLREQLFKEACGESERALRDLVGMLAEQIQACCGWLLIFDRPRHRLVSGVLHNTWRHIELPLSATAIVCHVARTGKPYLAEDVRRDPYYYPEVPDVRSALSVPIFAPDGELLGVLHFESFEPAAFSSAHLGDLQVSIVELVPHLLLQQIAIQDPQSYLWYPYRYDWSVERVLGRWVHTVTDVLPNTQVAKPCLTLWHVDWEKERVWVLAASRYDYEYVKDKTLPLDSFIGNVALLPRGEVMWTTPDDERFRRPDKARRMGLKQMLATPAYLPNDEERASCVLSAYYFDDRPQSELLPSTTLTWLAGELSTALWSYEECKLPVATAHVQQQLTKSRAPLIALMNGILKCIDAAECSIFALCEQERSLVSIATTGLHVSSGLISAGCVTDVERIAAIGRLEYKLDDSQDAGFTVYLARNPGTCVRKNDIPDRDEKGLPHEFPAPSNKHREICAHSDTDHRRFLGLSVAENGKVLGVIRVLRSSDSRPFRRVDQKLLKALGKLSVPLLGESRRLLTSLECPRFLYQGL